MEKLANASSGFASAFGRSESDNQGASGSTIKIQSLDDDEEEELELAGGDKLAVDPISSDNPSPLDYLRDKAPVPGNCCSFSTISCCKFWAIFNLVQVFPCWFVFVLSVHTADFPSDRPGDYLARCFEGGSDAAKQSKLAIQITFLLVYTIGSILFTIANFPPSRAFRLRSLFTTIYYGTCFCFFLAFSVPILFHFFLKDCYFPVSLLVWALLVSELVFCSLTIYLSWKVIKIFRKYLNTTTPEDDSKRNKNYDTPPTPQSSMIDIHEGPVKLASMSSMKEQVVNIAKKVPIKKVPIKKFAITKTGK